MPKTVVFLFHDDNASLDTGSHVAERVRQVASDEGVALEVFCFGPAQAALTEDNNDPVRTGYRNQIADLTAAGVAVHACLNAANAAGTAEHLSSLGITLEFARDAFVRYALEGATVVSF